VVKTLFEAIVLVFLVMYLFMGNIRATLIPTIAVPVVILGTFAVLGFFGFSINMLTMFAMVLAIGLLVDDAIVVVENVERVMSEEGLPPLEATRKSMDQITSALIGIGLVLSAVFGPMAFFGGSTGVIYRQFSVTVISAMLLSVLVALILTPVLCASLLKPVPRGTNRGERLFFCLPAGFSRVRPRPFLEPGQVSRSGGPILETQTARYLVIYLVIVAAWVSCFSACPPPISRMRIRASCLSRRMLPAGSTLEQTEQVLERSKPFSGR
jgi:multidrug efflux pump subunit AcrB